MIIGSQQADKNLFKKVHLGTLFSLIIGYRQHLRVVGNSMESTLKEGDLIIYKNLTRKNSHLKTGDIVIANHPTINRKLIIKRIHSINNYGIELRGDNLYSSSDSRQFGSIKPNQIVGLVERVIPS